MTRALILLSLLLATPVAAATEHLLNEPQNGSTSGARAAFTGGAYAVVWSERLDGDVVAHRLSRIDESGGLLGAPVEIGRGVGGYTLMASNGQSALIVFAENTPAAPPSATRFSGQWLDRDGKPFGATFAIAAEGAHIQSLSANGSTYFLVSGGSPLRVFALPQFATSPSVIEVQHEVFSSAVSVAASEDRVIILTLGPINPFPCGCPPPPVHAIILDNALRPIRPPVELSEFAEIIRAGDDFVRVTYRLSGFDLIRIDRHGNVIAERARTFGGTPSIVQSGDQTIAVWTRGYPHADIYFTPYERNLRPVPGLADEQAFSLSATFRNERLLALAGGTSTILGVYQTTIDDGANPQTAPTALAYRVIDLDALPPLPPAPRPLVIRGSSAHHSTSADFEWEAVAGAVRYHLEAISTDGSDARNVVVGGNATSVRFEHLRRGVEYHVRLLVENEHGLSAASAPIVVTTPVRFNERRRAAGR